MIKLEYKLIIINVNELNCINKCSWTYKNLNEWWGILKMNEIEPINVFEFSWAVLNVFEQIWTHMNTSECSLARMITMNISEECSYESELSITLADVFERSNFIV